MAVTEEPFAERAACVRRRFKTGRLDTMARGFWEHWRPGDSSLLVGMYSSIILLLLEPSLWFANWSDDLFSFRVPDWIALSLLLILPFNAWFLDRFLSSKTPVDAYLPCWLRGLRLLASSPPLFNLHTISLWKKFLGERALAEGLGSSRTAHLNLSRSRWRLSSGLQLRSLYRSGFLFAWIAVSLLPVTVWAVWLAGATRLGAWHHPSVLGACAFLHVISCISMALHFQLEIEKSFMSGWRRTLLRTAPFLWLFAIPGVVLGFAVYLSVKPSDNSLSWKIHAGRTGVNRDPLWQGLQDRLHQQWQGQPWFTQWRRPMGLSRSEGSSREDAELVSLYRLKTFLLALESLSLTALILRNVPTVVRSALWVAAVLTGTGLALQTLGLLARLFRVSRLREDLSSDLVRRYLMLTQAAVLAGTYGGTVLSQISIELFGLLLCLSAALCGVMTVLFLLPRVTSGKGPDAALWGVLYLALAALGVVIGLQGEGWRSSLLSFLRVSAVLSPLWSLGLFLAFSGWLLRPFTWRHVLDRRIPCRFRVVLAFVTLTAALPLGGLAIPFWIYARQRLWPQYEQRL
jgi:hypothetical protein